MNQDKVTKVKYSSFADIIVKKLGDGYLLKDSEIGGIGLFANKNFEKEEIICRYDGVKRHRADINEDIVTSHLLSIKDSDLLLDGLPMRKELIKCCKSNCYWPTDIDLYFQGWACMANSSRGMVNITPNAKMEYFVDDGKVRIENYNPSTQARIPNGLKHVLGKIPYLVAKRAILKGEEILWDYNPFLEKKIDSQKNIVEIIDLTKDE